MGQTLSEPVIEKTSDKGEDERLIFGVSAMQGWRISMEDSHTTILNLLAKDSEAAKAHASQLSYFGVFDGHGGEKVALFAGENIPEIMANQDTFKEANYEQALRDAFLATDRAILRDPKYQDEVSGCTACVSLLSGDKIYVANAGDSRGVLGVKGRAKPLSFDHKPHNEGEKARITAAGGFVDFGRVNGNLALSRAIGDFEFKKSAGLTPEQQIVTAYPDVMVHDISDDDEFMVIACDGIWDCQSSQAVIEFIRRGIAAKQDLDKICENLMDNCLASNCETGGVGCDNMTMIIVGFLRGRTKEQWYEEIARRVANGDGPCAPPEYAEFRGPGVHHGSLDSENGHDGGDRRPFPNGRIIFLGDGTEIQTDSDDGEMLDSLEEDSDLLSQVNATTPPESPPTPSAQGGESKPAQTNPAANANSSPQTNHHSGSATTSTASKVDNSDDSKMDLDA